MKIRFKFSVILIVIISSATVQAAQLLPGIDGGSKMTLKLEEGESAIFGFGSLMNVNMLENYGDKPYDGPFIMARLEGFRRTWSAFYPTRRLFEDLNGEVFRPKTMTFLNIEPCEGSRVNGMLFVCSKEELKLYDFRESSYNRIRINDYLDGITIIGGDAYGYMAKPEYFQPTESTPDAEMTSWQTVICLWYLDIIAEALEILGENFAADYHEFSQPVPWELVGK